MGFFRFRKSINLGGGVKLNAGKKGLGISAGVKGLRVSHGADGKTRVTASMPGTGISYQETLNKKKTTSNELSQSNVSNEYKFEQQSYSDKGNLLYKVYGEYLGLYDDREFDPPNRDLKYKTCEILFYEGEVSVNLNNVAYVREYCSIAEIDFSVKVEKKGIFSSKMKYILHIIINREPFGDTVLQVRIPNMMFAEDIKRAIQRKVFR
ncbi:hypothetical protein BBD42_21610 [Paenibacillus sp. BIHB 4019]|uniref:DUF4236 domain-containing protein n=1 Tax=Paenibacillus sp. BIHB 4019 TaxID=1870819 RepID=A0A1B2DM38_9BACL|nr:DUF4236 domain-containing protein [Paenibacillus sp. BIHB 4019]ANY68774.1 hypothetical protein BBD42_21610 [Paenibacillus sp. BIHB 4019]